MNEAIDDDVFLRNLAVWSSPVRTAHLCRRPTLSRSFFVTSMSQTRGVTETDEIPKIEIDCITLFHDII